ncbi:MAG: hypothetical protein ABI378_15130, partial [Chitinophagaceae bacterium]
MNSNVLSPNAKVLPKGFLGLLGNAFLRLLPIFSPPKKQPLNTVELYSLFLQHSNVQTDTRKLREGDLFFA